MSGLYSLCGAPTAVRFLISSQLKYALVRAPQNIPHFLSTCEFSFGVRSLSFWSLLLSKMADETLK